MNKCLRCGRVLGTADSCTCEWEAPGPSTITPTPSYDYYNDAVIKRLIKLEVLLEMVLKELQK